LQFITIKSEYKHLILAIKRKILTELDKSMWYVLCRGNATFRDMYGHETHIKKSMPNEEFLKG
jgi:hypothetical protein